MKIVSIVGARPQFVKEAAIQMELKKHPDINEVLIHTGQHYDVNMSDVFFSIFNMRMPDYNLGVKASLHGEMTGEMLKGIEQILIKENPDLVLLYGDTNSTLAGAVAASKLKMKTAHVEAGLRVKIPKYMPEETNRVLTDHVAEYLFCPCKKAIDNLAKEGIVDGVFFSGDVMYDIFQKMRSKFDCRKMETLGLEKDNYIMMTMHRDYNVDDKEVLKEILCAVDEVAKDMRVIYPLHPRTRQRIEAFGLSEKASHIEFIESVDYLQLMGLTENCFKVITDSGGYQKESYFAGKPAAVIMPETPWEELVDYGINRLITPNELREYIFDSDNTNFVQGIYGDGNAAEKIVASIKEIKA